MSLPGQQGLVPSGSQADSTSNSEMNTFKSFVTVLADPNAKDDIKLKAAQELMKNLEVILNSPLYPTFLEHAIKLFLKILQDGEPYFISEYNIQQVRKLILEMLHRLPTNDLLKPYVKPILSLMLKLLELENEENVLVCLRIIIELHKQFRPPFNPEIQHFLHFVKSIYQELPKHLESIFEPRPPIVVSDLSEINLDEILQKTFTVTSVQTSKKTKDGTIISYNLIPKAILSLKVLQELPIIVVLMYQLYKANVPQDVADFIPLVMTTITLQPSVAQRSSPYFNKEVFVDFMGAQVKTLSFLAFIIKMYQDTVAQHSHSMVQGMLGLLTLCPMEVAHLRRELLIATRHILATELRVHFVPHMEQLFDEDILLGRGWTTYESLRPLAYSTLADLVHHVRQHLQLPDLVRAVHLFSKNVHDESLATNIQTVSCKLLLNLVDCIRMRSEGEGEKGCQLLMKMLQVFVLKFKTIAKIHLPILINHCKQNPPSTPAVPVPPQIKTEPGVKQTSPSQVQPKVEATINELEQQPERKYNSPPVPNINDYRSLVKTLVFGVKTITWGCASCKNGGAAGVPPKPFLPHETLVFVRLVKWAMKALDVYTLPVGQIGPQRGATPQHNVRTKEEKEVLEHFSGVFSMMNAQTFREIFSTTIEYLVERIHKNSALQTVASTFLANPPTSPIFATILVEYLLERMSEMGSDVERSNLYLRLFKLVFGSVTLFPTDNENMLRPHLHQIVNRSMELAMTAKEPVNYFFLLRALFRSIGGGSHDLLYQEFLPLLPNLLEGLNRLQSGLHKQQMRDLFVELCLTVPVRLSSLLPYLPMLMDPLVSALNGSQILISQGLRTLELCVDNLQPDFLYEHIQPVRADLMQALWRTLRNQDQVAQVAFRVLGKFGGGNRKMMIEPQKLEYIETDLCPPAVICKFQDYGTPIELPVEKIIDTAFTALKQSNTHSYYRRKAWEVIHCYLAASLSLEDDRHLLLKLFMYPSFQEGEIPHLQGSLYKSKYKRARETHQTALTGMFVAVAIKELNTPAFQTMVKVVRHYTMIAVAQQAGSFTVTNKNEIRGFSEHLDPQVLVDALAAIMGHEEKELCKPGYVAMGLMLETAATILGGKEKACQLPLMEYLSEKMCSLCYERAWYTKLGGCLAIRFLFERMAPRWVYDHLFVFLKALMFVMMDLTGEVSSGALDSAKGNLERMLMMCVTPPTIDNPELVQAQSKALYDVTHELVRQVTSPHTLVREEAMKSLRLLAEKQGNTVTEVIRPHKEVLTDMIPPKKHLLRHQPANAQIGLMDGNTFCTTLEPRLFTINLTVPEHKIFVHELLTLCESEDAALSKFACYKSVSNFVSLRKSALRALAACHYLEPKNYCDNIFNVLYKALERNNDELQETAYECMKKFITGYQIDMKIVHELMRPLLNMLGDYRSLNLNSTKRFSYLTKLFPSAFNEKFCEQLLEILKKLFEVTVQQNTGLNKNSDNVQQIATIIDIFFQTPATSAKFIPELCNLVLQTERTMLIEASSPFREPLTRFLARYPAETLEYFLDVVNIKAQQYSRYLEVLLKHPTSGEIFREYLQNNLVPRLLSMLLPNQQLAGELSEPDRQELQYQSIRIISILVKYDKNWIRNNYVVILNLNKIWCSDEYLERHKKVENVNYIHWKEPKLIAKILLHDFITRPGNPSMLFQLLRAFCDRYIPNFQFLKDFLENEVAQNYPVEWKRSAFFKFVEVFPSLSISQELKAKILQLILIPCFTVSFQKGEITELIGCEPSPDLDSKDNVVSVFISELIDPDRPFGCADCVRISLLQFSCLLVEYAAPYIHDAANKQHGHKVRRLMTFAWPCLLGKSCVDPVTRYHGHILLSHIIDKFAIHRKIILQVFHSLLTAHAMEARNVVRQALDILTPSVPVRVDDGNTMFSHWTKKIIVEEGHSVQQLFHILQIVVRHFKVYFPVRHHIVQHMINSIQRLGFSPTATIEHRKLAFELADVIIKWELMRLKKEYESDGETLPGTLKRPASETDEHQRKKFLTASGVQTVSASSSSVSDTGAGRPIDRAHADSVVNFLLRLACQVNDTAQAQGVAAPGPTPGETLSRKCVSLLKIALKPDVWSQQCDLKLGFFDKIFATVESTTPNYGNICTALELLTFLLTVMKKDQILTSFKPLQRGLGACITSTNSKVIRLVHGFLSRLMAIFPTESTDSNLASKHEELELLYSTVRKVISDGLSNYEKNLSASPSSLFGTLMMLKAACVNNHSYIDRLITPFMKVLHRMAREHLQPTNPDTSSVTVELLILSLDLVKTRVVVLGVEMRKTFIGSTLVGLIEKSTEVKIIKAIIKILEEWMKNKNPVTLSQAPSLREKSILLVKLMQYVEKRFPDDQELNAQFLELVNYVYRDKVLKSSELTSKLEPAFMAGLRCTQPHIRAKFFEVFDESMRRRFSDRLMYIICSQNWDAIGPHYWIKQCIELVLTTALQGNPIRLSHESAMVPNICSVVNCAESTERDRFLSWNPTEEFRVEIKEEVLDMDISNEVPQSPVVEEKKPILDRTQMLPQVITKHSEFLIEMSTVTTDQFLTATAQLCHMDTPLAEAVWLSLFPRLWEILEEPQRQAFTAEIAPFLTSGGHIIQKDCHPSALNTFVEALNRCSPPVTIIPPLMKYLGKSHNLWHRMALNLEQQAFDTAFTKPKRETVDCYDFEPDQSAKNELLDSLGELYWLLCEEDLWSGLWQKHAHYKETNIAIAYEQQGFFEQAQVAYEQAMNRHKQDSLLGPTPAHTHREMQLWTEHWVRCAKELNQWDQLLEYAKKGHYDPYLMLESSWHVPDWDVMKEALTNVEYNCAKELAWKVTLYGGYLAICHPKEKHLQVVERYVEGASSLCMKEWRRLPHIVSHIHLPYLQAVQQIIELQEAAQIYQGLNRHSPSSLHDMNAIVKTWRNRLPVIADDLTHWSDIFTWRQHHYQFIVGHFDSQEISTKHDPAMKPSMVGVHASAQAIIHFAKVARKHNLPSVCLDSLSRIYTIPSVPIVDCFQKIRQQVKCYLLMASLGDKNSLQEALDALVSTNVSYFPSEMTAMISELYALKGMVLALTGCSNEANKEFSAAVQLHDTLIKAWSLYGDYLEQVIIFIIYLL